MSDVRPFPNGTAWIHWTEVNCDRCVKATMPTSCAIEKGMHKAEFTGVMTRYMAKRAGLPFKDWNQVCPERVAKTV